MSTESIVRSFDRVSDYLAWDHRRLDEILSEVVHRVQTAFIDEARERYRDFEQGLDRHIRLEEELLFPVFEARSGISSGPTAVMRTEHRQIRQALDMMRDALADRDAPAFCRGREWLDSVLPEHDAKEESILYPMTDRMLSDEERAVLVSRLKSF